MKAVFVVLDAQAIGVRGPAPANPAGMPHIGHWVGCTTTGVVGLGGVGVGVTLAPLARAIVATTRTRIAARATYLL